jgi:hypothetical protein
MRHEDTLLEPPQCWIIASSGICRSTWFLAKRIGDDLLRLPQAVQRMNNLKSNQSIQQMGVSRFSAGQNQPPSAAEFRCRHYYWMTNEQI